jgi:membrane-bound lytic murein transglycosylase A
MIRRALRVMGAAYLLAACTTQPSLEACPAAAPCPVCPVCPAPVAPAPAAPKASLFEPVTFADLPGWQSDELADILGALRASCRRLRTLDAWRPTCADAAALQSDAAAVRVFFETRLMPWRVSAADGAVNGLVTGYYEPLLRGSRSAQGPYRYPLYGPPEDLLVIDLAAINPELRNMRLRGRLEGRRVVPYYSRAEIERGVAAVQGKEIVWVADPVEAFFLQIQGSGRVQLENGDRVRIGYADQNGHPYRSIGRALIESGELSADAASMQGIQQWARANPEKVEGLLNKNPSYVFFRELPQSASDPALGPLGAMGVPLTPQRSIAVDARFIPLGAPVFLATTWPDSDQPLARLVFAQDTGGAIRGAVRADFFWGFGADAGAQAGRMKQQGRMWLLWPRGSRPPAP